MNECEIEAAVNQLNDAIKHAMNAIVSLKSRGSDNYNMHTVRHQIKLSKNKLGLCDKEIERALRD